MNPLSKRLLSVLSIIALVAIPLSGRAADPLEINVIFAMTGSSAFVGKEGTPVLALIEESVNKSGGIGGRPIKFVIQDDQSSAQVAVQLAGALLAKNVPVILGPNPVAACSALAPVLKDKAVMFCVSAAYHPPPNSNFYVAGISTTDQIIFAARYLRQRGLRKIASITTVDANGIDADNGINQALKVPENSTLSLVAAEHFALNDLTVAAQMSRIKASGAQAIITGNNGTPLGVILHAYTDLGLELPLVTTSGALNVTTVTQFATILPREFLVAGQLGDGPDVVPEGPAKVAIRNYINACRAAGIEPDHTHAATWDPALIIIAALRKIGPNATAAQIDSFIHNLHGWAGVSGIYDFRNGNQSGLDPSSLIMVRWNPERSMWSAVSKPGGAPLGR